VRLGGATRDKQQAQIDKWIQELSAIPWFERGVDATDPAEEIRFLTEAIDHDPTHPFAYFNRALVDTANLFHNSWIRSPLGGWELSRSGPNDTNAIGRRTGSTNVVRLATVPHGAREAIAAIVRTVFAQPDHASALTQLRKIADASRARFPRAAAVLEEARKTS
jgi:hypothetical protein